MQPAPVTTSRPTHVRHVVLGLTVAAYMITYMDRQVLAVTRPVIMKDLGISLLMMGNITFAFRIVYALFQIPGGETALLRAIDGGGHVDAESEIGLFDGGYEIGGGRAVVEHGGYRGGGVESLDYGVEVGLCVAVPMGERSYLFGRAESAAVDGVAEVYGLELDGQLEELA